MYYYETDNRAGRRAGIIAVAVYLVLLTVMFLLLKITLSDKEVGQGILIDFGNTENAVGLNDPGLNEVVQEQQRQAQTAPERALEQLLTQDDEEAPEIAQVAPENRSQPAEQVRQGDTQPADTTPVEKPRVADPRLNFPGRTEGSTSTSQGTTEGAGNQGREEGAPGGDPDGTGVGNEGNSFDLTGRSAVGGLPKPDYPANKGGRVVIEITVDSKGIVVNAVYRGKGSTTNDASLLNAALKAARQSRFSKIEGEGLQTGTITYNFQLQ